MKNARGTRAVRLAKQEPEKEVAVAAVAIELGMLEDAERLYKECGRYDLLVKLYMAAGKWTEALKLSSSNDRIHLKTVHYLYAKYLEVLLSFLVSSLFACSNCFLLSSLPFLSFPSISRFLFFSVDR
jgi:hypothetical protein